MHIRSYIISIHADRSQVSVLHVMSQEQFFTRTLEDALAIAGRLDVRVFSEADQIFHFGPVWGPGSGSWMSHDMIGYDKISLKLKLHNYLNI